MKVIIAYDVTARHEEVKDALLAKGFRDKGTRSSITYFFPSSTLWHPSLLNANAAINVFQETINELNSDNSEKEVIEITRLLAFELKSFSGTPGKSYP